MASALSPGLGERWVWQTRSGRFERPLGLGWTLGKTALPLPVVLPGRLGSGLACFHVGQLSWAGPDFVICSPWRRLDQTVLQQSEARPHAQASCF